MIPVARFKIFSLALFMALSDMGCTEREETQTEKTTHDEDAEAITAVSKARAEAFDQGNAHGIAQHFTEDAVLMAPMGKIRCRHITRQSSINTKPNWKAITRK